MGTTLPNATITDDRGVTRPLWDFPATESGVPPECPVPAREQRQIELSLGAPAEHATPAAPTRREALQTAIVYTAWAITLGAATSVIPWPLLALAVVLFWFTLIELNPSWNADLAPLRWTLMVLLALAVGVACIGWLAAQARTPPMGVLLA